MNKKIKVIELINRIYENLDVPKKVKYAEIEYEWDKGTQDYKYKNKGYVEKWLFQELHKISGKWIEREVEILEDEEEIDIQGIEELVGKVNVRINNKTVDAEDLFYTISNIALSVGNLADKTNQLVKIVKQLDKKMNKED